MSLHFNLQCQRATLASPLLSRFLTGILSEVGGERFVLRFRSTVVSSSATGAAYGPLGTPRQQLFSRWFWRTKTGEVPTPQRLSAHFSGGSSDRCCCCGFPRGTEAPRWPGALLYERGSGSASGFLQDREIFCRCHGRIVHRPDGRHPCCRRTPIRLPPDQLAI